ncbi:MAG: ABC transporter substrate-binding protein [Lachnospiraceae bacterium]|uniref:ABC transporter substrate-binding protein n=1 Tax=Candidatus Enterocloster excrementigallinarum TaxID=2838558 RepID=A0A9D2PVK0_9FIRM|nr:ABC transporter substrate-binding protein [Lachnospiraceae bacterium]HJC67979.1 ABC transporter substrate-binding protein [Candidatus Enterocloster excrementigallinarum]
MKKKVALAAAAGLAAAAVSLSACSGGSGAAGAGEAVQGGSGTENASDDALHLTFYYPVNVGGSAAALIEQICADFNKEHPDIVVEPVYTGNYDDTVTKIQTAIQGGTPPDVFVSLATQRFTMASTGMAMPLDDLIAADGEEGQAYIDDFLDGFMLDSYVDGKIYSIPFQRSTMVLFYNKDAFAEVGLDPEAPPETWEEVVEYGQKLTNENRYGVGLALNSGSAQWAFTGFCLQNSVNGENLMTDDGKQVLFDTPENVEALQFWLDLQNKYQIMAPGIVQWTDLPTQFLAGEVAMIYHTTGNMANINENAEFEFGAAFLPGNKRVAAPTGGGNFYISNGISEERVQAAWEFIKFATDTERAAQWSLDTGYVATRESCFETDLIKNYYEEVPQAKVAYDQIPYSAPELTTYNAAEIWRVLNDNIQSAVVGDATPQEALTAAQEQATEILAEYQ